MSTRKNIILNGIASVFAKTVRIADQLLLVPFFLTAWGSAYYGEWLTLSAIPSILAFADLGFGTATSNAFVLNYRGGKKQLSADYYVTGLRLVSGSVVIGILLTAIIMGVAWFSGLLDKSLINPNDAILAMLFLMTSRFVSFYNQVYEAFYRTTHHAARATNLITVEGFLRIGISILVLMLGYGVVALSLSQLLIIIVFNIAYALYGRSMIKDLPKGNWDRNIAGETVKKGLAFLANPLWQAIYYQGSTFVVRAMLGPSAVAVFNTVRTLCRSINQVFNIVSLAVFPELQIAVGDSNMPLARKILRKSMRLVLVSSIIGIVGLLIFGKPVYNWWTKNMLEVPDLIWYMFMAGLLFNALWFTSSVVYKAVNQPYRFAMFSLISAVVSVALSYFLSYPLGLVGVSIGYVFLDVLMTILVMPYACKLLGMSWREVFANHN